MLSKIGVFADTQPHLRSLAISFPESILPIRGRLENLVQLFMKRYTDFVSTIEKFIQCPHFEVLTLRNVLTIQTAQQIIRTFLSIPITSNPQLLDIRTPDDTNLQSDSLLNSSHCDNPAKSLKISGTARDKDKELLTSLVFPILCNTDIHCFEVIDTISGIVSALKQPLESLQVKNLSLTIRKIKTTQINTTDASRSQYRRCGSQHLSAFNRRLFQGNGVKVSRQEYHRQCADRKRTEEADVSQSREFPEIPMINKVISNPSLLTPRICLQSTKDYIASSQVPSFLSTIFGRATLPIV